MYSKDCYQEVMGMAALNLRGTWARGHEQGWLKFQEALAG